MATTTLSRWFGRKNNAITAEAIPEERDLSHLSIEELCEEHRKVSDDPEALHKVVLGGMAHRK
jgi:hypothetical protein